MEEITQQAIFHHYTWRRVMDKVRAKGWTGTFGPHVGMWISEAPEVDPGVDGDTLFRLRMRDGFDITPYLAEGEPGDPNWYLVPVDVLDQEVTSIEE